MMLKVFCSITTASSKACRPVFDVPSFVLIHLLPNAGWPSQRKLRILKNAPDTKHKRNKTPLNALVPYSTCWVLLAVQERKSNKPHDCHVNLLWQVHAAIAVIHPALEYSNIENCTLF